MGLRTQAETHADRDGSPVEYERNRITKVTNLNPRLKQLPPDDPACGLFDSYAIVKNKSETLLRFGKSNQTNRDLPYMQRERQFVPLPLRSMSTMDWKALFWLDVEKLVINGKEKKGGLCGQCDKYLSCVQDGVGQKRSFECTTNHRHLSFLISRKSKT